MAKYDRCCVFWGLVKSLLVQELGLKNDTDCIGDRLQMDLFLEKFVVMTVPLAKP